MDLKFKDLVHHIEFLPSGELLVVQHDSITFIDARGKKTRTKKLRLGSFVLIDGRMFVASGKEVHEWNLATLTQGAQLPIPKSRSKDGSIAELVASPDGSKLAIATSHGDIHIYTFATKKTQTFGYLFPNRREQLAFVSGKMLGFVAGLSTITFIKFDGSTSPGFSGGSWASFRDGLVVTGDAVSSTVTLWRRSGRKVATFNADAPARGVQFVPGHPLIAVASHRTLYLFDDKTLKLETSIAIPRGVGEGPDTMYVSSDRIALAYAGERLASSTVYLFDVPSLKSSTKLAPILASEKLRDVAKKPAPVEKAPKPVKARPSPFRARFQDVIDRLKAIKGTSVTAELGGTATAAQQRGFPVVMQAMWSALDGVSITWSNAHGEGQIGLASLAELAHDTSEDVFWNDQFSDQTDGSMSLGALKKLKVLCRLDGRAEAIGIALGKKPKLIYSETNEGRRIPFELADYITTLLSTAGILGTHEAMLGTAQDRKALEAKLAIALPGWPKPIWKR